MPRSVLRKMPAWNPVKAVSVDTGEPVLAMRMGDAFSFHVPDVVDGDVVLGHGGMVGGRSGDYVVLWDGEFCSCTPLEVVPVSVLEDRRLLEDEERRVALAAQEAARVAEEARVAHEASDALRREQEAAAARDESARIVAALPRADEVPSEDDLARMRSRVQVGEVPVETPAA